MRVIELLLLLLLLLLRLLLPRTPSPSLLGVLGWTTLQTMLKTSPWRYLSLFTYIDSKYLLVLEAKAKAAPTPSKKNSVFNHSFAVKKKHHRLIDPKKRKAVAYE